MIAEVKRIPMVLAGELLEKIGAIDWTALNGEAGSTAERILMHKGAIKAALEQIKSGKIPAMHVRMFDVMQELSAALASIKEAFQNSIFEFHSLETTATADQAPGLVAQRKKAEQLYDTVSRAKTTFATVWHFVNDGLPGAALPPDR
jgi:hypothetical protein